MTIAQIDFLHKLGNALGTLNLNIGIIKHFILDKVKDGTLDLDEPVVPVFEENTPEHIESFKLKYVLENLPNSYVRVATLFKELQQIFQQHDNNNPYRRP